MSQARQPQPWRARLHERFGAKRYGIIDRTFVLPPLMLAIATADIAHAIQLAVAPVFLLTGIAALLGVMTNRLARIIDRGRWFEQRWAELDEASRARYALELGHLERRRRLASRAINGCTAAALLICLVIATLFIEGLFGVELRGLAGVLFLAAMAGLIAGLSLFLREVHLATYAVRVTLHLPPSSGPR